MRAMVCLLMVVAGCGGGGSTCNEKTKGYVDCEIGGMQCQPGQYCGRDVVGAPVCVNGCLSDANCGCNQVCTKTAGQNEGVCSLHAAMAVCGDGVCDVGETPQSCPGDCHVGAVCGDGVCAASESGATCPKDCPDVAHCRRECESYDFFACFAAGALQSCYDRCARASASQITQFTNCAATATTSCDTSCLDKLPL